MPAGAGADTALPQPVIPATLRQRERREQMSRPPPKRRDSEQSRKLILQAALQEFSEHGHQGARVDRISARAGVSKPLIYDYFGDKDAVYAAALKEAYIQIREGERELDLESLPPAEAVRTLVRFTLNHYLQKPWFITMLSDENLRGGEVARSIAELPEVQSVLLDKLRDLLTRGAAEGVFREGVDPVEFYVSVASACWFPVSNRFTLNAVFNQPIDDAWYARRAEIAADMLLAYLAPGPKSAPSP